VSARLRVDWTLCEGRGLCLELLPELVRADDWGYPMPTGDVDLEVPQALRDHAEAAVRECPRLALRLVTDAGPPR
jgi:ferredoxin